MSRGRLMIVLGGLVSLCASAGLLVFGPSVVGVLDVLTWSLGEPPSEALGGLAAAAVCAVLFAAGVALASAGQVVASRTAAATVPGRLLLALAGVAGLFGALAMIYGVWGAQVTFSEVAAAESTPRPQQIVEAISQAVPRARCGFANLLLAQVLLVAAGLVGFKGESQPSGSSPGGAVLAGPVAACALLFALLYAGNWWLHGRSLETLLATPGRMPHAAELAGHMSAVMRNAQQAAVCLALGGALQAILALRLPGKARDLA